MTDEELESTGLFGIIRNQDDLDIGEQLEELEDRLDYLDLDKEKTEEIINLINEIREEEKMESKELLFNKLMKELDG